MGTNRKGNCNPFMLGQSREEWSRQLEILESILADIDQGLSPQQIDDFLHAIQTIKVAARVIGLPVVVSLARALEEFLSEIRRRELRLLPPHIDQFLQASAIFRSVWEQEEKNLPCWLNKEKTAIRQVTKTLWKYRAGMEETSAPKVSEESMPLKESAEWIEAAVAIAEATVTTAVQSSPEIPPDEDFLNQKSEADGGEEGVPHQDNLIQLASECLFQAKRIQDLNFSLRIQEGHIPVSEKQLDKEARYKKGDFTVFPGKASTRDSLHQFDRCFQRLEFLVGQLYDNIVASRMPPFASLIRNYPSKISDLSKKHGKTVIFKVAGELTAVDRDVITKLGEPLWQTMRSLVIHSLETPSERVSAGKNPVGIISLEISNKAGMLHLTLTDDGRGIYENKNKDSGQDGVIDTPSTAINSNTLNTMIASMDGTVDWETRPGEGDRIRLIFPSIHSVLDCLLVKIGGESYALPMYAIERVAKVSKQNLLLVEGQPSVSIDGENLVYMDAGEIFTLPAVTSAGGDMSVVVLQGNESKLAFVVETIVGEERLVLRMLDERLGKVAYIRAAAILGDGTVTLVLDMSELFRALDIIVVQQRLEVIGFKAMAASLSQSKNLSGENIPWPFWRR